MIFIELYFIKLQKANIQSLIKILSQYQDSLISQIDWIWQNILNEILKRFLN